jgi:cytochrome c553
MNPASLSSGARRLGRLLLLSLSLALLGVGPVRAADATPTSGIHTVPDTMAQRVMACTLCHGQQGRATSSGFFPRIAGKPAGYLYNQLRNFREGRRQNPGMAKLLDPLSDGYLRTIAEHFASLDLPYPPPQTTGAAPAVLARAEVLIRQGDAARELPACAACHGDALTGVQPAVPGLLGLPRDYLIGQLGAWQTGLRHAHAPDCMAQVAQALSPEEVGALATWLSSQPLPSDSHPAPAPAKDPPLRCGSALAQAGVGP